MRAIGRVSYSWYLWHWPVLRLAAALGHRLGVGATVAAVGLSLTLAVLTMRYVENPVRFPLRCGTHLAEAWRWAGSPRLPRSVAGVITLVAVHIRQGAVRTPPR